MNILVVDDEKRACEAISEFLQEDFEVEMAFDGGQALEILKNKHFDMVITDHSMPNLTGIELIKESKKLYPDTVFIMVTAHSSLDHAIEAMRSGADDYLVKPINFTELENRVLRFKQVLSWKNKNRLSEQYPKALDKIIGSSPVVQQMKELVLKVAEVPTPILINGPSGVGKEMLAKAIHQSGARCKEPFVAINCATLSEELLESELFGHEKGSFTGATKAKAGKFELANEGTLFLDEIAELAPTLQAKLLRVLQEKEFYRVGGNRLLKTNCRILAATHQNLQEMVKQGAFREDLYYRLNVLRFEIPELDHRKEDIPELVEFFLEDLGQQLGFRCELSSEVFEYLKNKTYVGNIRELKNEVERILVLNQGKSVIQLSDVSSSLLKESASTPSVLEAETDYRLGLNELVESLERKAIKQALEDHNYNQVQTAKALNITRGSLQYKMQKYGFSQVSAA